MPSSPEHVHLLDILSAEIPEDAGEQADDQYCCLGTRSEEQLQCLNPSLLPKTLIKSNKFEN